MMYIAGWLLSGLLSMFLCSDDIDKIAEQLKDIAPPNIRQITLAVVVALGPTFLVVEVASRVHHTFRKYR